jgi:hypothetical protein
MTARNLVNMKPALVFWAGFSSFQASSRLLADADYWRSVVLPPFQMPPQHQICTNSNVDATIC